MGRVVIELVIDWDEIMPDADTVTVPPAADVDGGFCSVFTNNTFIGIPPFVDVYAVVVPDADFAHKNCCGLKLNCAVLPFA